MRKMGNMAQTIVVLTLFCACSGFVLSYLKNVTAPAIEEQLLINVQAPALGLVFNNAENNPLQEREVFTLASGDKVTVFPCKVGGRITGVAMENFGTGYGGPVGVMVGFNISNDSLAGVGMTTLKETPGLGMRVRDFAFRKQFRGMETPVAFSSAGGKVDAVAGATISSTGVVNAVNNASKVYRELKPEILKKWDH